MKDFALIYVMTLIVLTVVAALAYDMVFSLWAVALPVAAVIYGFLSQSRQIEELKRRVQELEGKHAEEETADAENA